ncbi:MAG: prolipoprotein diacylglyceryl transferase [Faecalibacterium sp.]|jgi:phosphatidylglycerol:prolipoprotein diacylglycerol transferase|nr:prolipoprotein diacylglyceryl transferase [Faecalibacterium sp.]
MDSYLVTFPGMGLEFNIHRVAFSIGGLNIYWYGLLIATGLLLAVIYAFRHAVEFGIDADRLIDVVCIGTVMAIVCARIYYVAMSPYAYDNVWEMFAIRDGGIAIYGALIGAFVFGGLACIWRKIPLLATYDLVAMGFLIGQGIGRWGNFVNQEAFGYNTTLPWGMYSIKTQEYLQSSVVTLPSGMMADPALPVHPTFLYESLWCLVGFVMLALYFKKRKFNGDVALLYAIWYGLGRFWIEGLRTDSLLLVPSIGLRASQLVAAVTVFVSLALEIYLRKKCKGQPMRVALPLSSDNLKALKAQGGKYAAQKNGWVVTLGQRAASDGPTAAFFTADTLAVGAPHAEYAKETETVNRKFAAWLKDAPAAENAKAEAVQSAETAAPSEAKHDDAPSSPAQADNGEKPKDD